MAPFRNIVGPKANLGILIVLFVLVLGLICTLAALSVAMDKAERIEIFKIIGFCSIVLGQIALLIRAQSTAEYLHQATHETRNVVNQSALTVKLATEEMAAKTNGGLSEAIKTACGEAREAERAQLLPLMLQSPDLRTLIHDVAVEVCDELKGEGERRVDRPPYGPPPPPSDRPALPDNVDRGFGGVT